MKESPPPAPKSAWSRIDAHHRFMFSCIVAAIAFVAVPAHSTALRMVTTWDVFAAVTIGLIVAVMLSQDPYEVRRNAGRQDANQTFLFTIVVSAATASLFAVFLLLASAKNLTPRAFPVHVSLSVAAIILSWVLVHLLFALRYAHLYYRGAHHGKREEVAGGLLFPEDKRPDYLDFAYFSFVVGMTCQVSDVQISAKRLRRLATVHGLISFVFNTAILALFVNIVAGLI